MLISIGNDHAGTTLKEAVKEELVSLGHEISDKGTDGKESVDYPDFIHPVADDVEKGKAEYGIIICGSGNGAAMTANKHQGVRAAICWNKEIAKLAKQHNNANVISIPSRFLEKKEIEEIITAFLESEFEGGRHERRVKKIPKQ